MKRVAVIGCGAIGSELVKAVAKGIVRAELVALFDMVKDKCVDLVGKYGLKNTRVVESIDDLLATNPDVVVEAASQDAVRQYAIKILERGSSLVVLSVGALMDRDLLGKLVDIASRSGARIYVPSGAIAGLDALKAIRIVGVNRVVIRTRKPPRSLKPCGALSYRPESVTQPTVVYRGRASEAVKVLPFNVNVAAALSLASGIDVEVEVVADPTIDRNVHEIIVDSPASRITIRIENVPSPSNPKTSYLAALSAIALLKKVCEEEVLDVGI